MQYSTIEMQSVLGRRATTTVNLPGWSGGTVMLIRVTRRHLDDIPAITVTPSSNGGDNGSQVVNVYRPWPVTFEVSIVSSGVILRKLLVT